MRRLDEARVPCLRRFRSGLVAGNAVPSVHGVHDMKLLHVRKRAWRRMSRAVVSEVETVCFRPIILIGARVNNVIAYHWVVSPLRSGSLSWFSWRP